MIDRRTPEENLIIAVVAQAVMDLFAAEPKPPRRYSGGKRKTKKQMVTAKTNWVNKIREVKRNRESAIMFFQSGYCELVMAGVQDMVDGGELAKRVMAYYEEGRFADMRQLVATIWGER